MKFSEFLQGTGANDLNKKKRLTTAELVQAEEALTITNAHKIYSRKYGRYVHVVEFAEFPGYFAFAPSVLDQYLNAIDDSEEMHDKFQKEGLVVMFYSRTAQPSGRQYISCSIIN